jgi:hypothetical protein
LDIESYVSSHPKLNLKRTGNRGEYRGWCPFHPEGNYDCFAINVVNGKWQCRSARCGLRGGFALFYKLLEGIRSWKEVRSQLGERLPIRDWSEVLSLSTRPDQVPVEQRCPLPPPHEQYPIGPDSFPAYLRQRGFDESLLDLGFDLRWCHHGFYAGRVLLPFYNVEGDLLTFTARLAEASDGNREALGQRYRFPQGLTTDRFLYGVWRLNWVPALPRIWLVEGQFDVIRLATLGEFALGLSTNTPSSRQLLDIREIQKVWQVPILVCLDRGAYPNTLRIWSQLRAMGCEAHALDIDSVAKDPGVLTSEGRWELLQQLQGGHQAPETT